MSSPLFPAGRPAGAYPRSSLYCGNEDTSTRPSQHLANGSTYASNHGRQAEWTFWQELSVKISDLPASTTTRDLWRCFSGQGTINLIEFFENQRGQREGNAVVKFRYACLWHFFWNLSINHCSPPPQKQFWKNECYSIHIAAEGMVTVRLYLEPRKRNFTHPSPVDARKNYEEVMV